MNDHELRSLYQQLLARRDPGRDRCVAPEDLMRLAAGEATEAERLDWLDHVAACPDCHRDLDLARAVAAAGQAITRRSVHAGWFALAASLLVVVGGTVVWRSGLLTRGDIMRGAEDRVILVAPLGAVPAAEASRLVWRALPGGSFSVEVLDASGGAVFTATTSDTVLPLPPGALQPGGEYRWRVSAILPDGSRRRSTAAAVHIGAP